MVISHLGLHRLRRGGKTPALTVVATVGVVAGLFLKPGLCAPTHGSTGGWIGEGKMGIAERLLH